MSRTLSKILVICAMVVVFPLMIVGTAFASFYSIDATTIVEVYVGSHTASADAFAKVQYEDQADTKLSITEGHLNQIKIKTLSNGYDFLGWYAGSVEEYLEEENAQLLSSEDNLCVKISDYDNLVAIFETKSYSITWDYIANPESNEMIQVAPEGSKETYYWGDALPVLTHSNFDFNGWTIEGDDTFYSAAKFANSGEIKLNAKANSWTSHGQVTINYYDENGVLINDASETIYKGEAYQIKNVSELVSTQAGYKYTLKDKDGNSPIGSVTIPREYESNQFDFFIDKNAVNYTATLAQGNVATYNKSTAIAFTVENKASLEALFDEENWSKYSFHEITGFTFEDATYTKDQIDLFVSKVVDLSKHNETNVDIEVSIKQYFSTFRAQNVGLISDTEAIYQQGEFIEYTFNGNVSNAATATIEQLLNIEGKTFVKDYEDEASVVDIAGVRLYWSDGSYNDFNVTRTTVLNDLIETIIEKLGAANFENAEEFVVSKLVVRFV